MIMINEILRLERTTNKIFFQIRFEKFWYSTIDMSPFECGKIHWKGGWDSS